MKIKIYDCIQTDTAISYDDGVKCMNEVLKYIDDDVVELDFEGVNYVITAFLNPVIGDVIDKKGSEVISKMHFSNVNQDIQKKIGMLARGALLSREDLE